MPPHSIENHADAAQETNKKYPYSDFLEHGSNNLPYTRTVSCTQELIWFLRRARRSADFNFFLSEAIH